MTYEEFQASWLPLRDPLYRLAWGILESEEDAADAVQDLYAKLWSIRDGLDSVHNPKAYCITLLRRMCIDRLRRVSPQRLKEGQELESEDVGIERGIVEKEQLRQVRSLIERLPERERKVLVLKVLEERSYEEVASITGINYLTLRVLVSNARRKIKKGLG